MGANDGANRRASALRRLTVAVGLVMAALTVSGQTVHRCEIKGKVSYSHEPCVDANAVGVKPKQGADGPMSRKGNTPQQAGTAARGPVENKLPSAPTFRCDGRLHCSQMTSCSEAKQFLKHCPGVKMDGDGDGVPCEQQWCTGG